jgi:hypothetical protein
MPAKPTFHAAAQPDECQIDKILARIFEPVEGEIVERAFKARGTIAEARGCYVWLAVRWGGLYWPKEPVIDTRSAQWEMMVFEGGEPPSGRFSLTLIAVTREANGRFGRWFTDGKRSGYYPGMPLPVGSRILDQKSLRLR